MPALKPSVGNASLRLEVSEAAQILRMSRAQLYNRNCQLVAETVKNPGSLRACKLPDGPGLPVGVSR
jgi:hypothetical protein